MKKVVFITLAISCLIPLLLFAQGGAKKKNFDP